MKSTWEAIDFFEKLIADYAGSKYAVAIDSCTNSIFLALKYCITRNLVCEYVDVPKRTYLSVPMQVLHAGYKINFVDNNWEKIYRLDPLPIIDSAQKFEKNMYIKDTYYCLSFHNKKSLPIGKGGMILTDSYEAYDWFKSMRHDGRNLLNLNQKDITNIGYHMYMTPEQAIRGIELFYSHETKCNIFTGYNNYHDISKLTCFNKI